MGLKAGDLENTVLKKISIDEYEPKTGESKDVMVVGFLVKENAAGADLYHFISSSITEVRDVEVSPNPNSDNYFMVFVEMDRNPDAMNTLRQMVRDIENVTGKLNWQATSQLTEEYFSLFSEEIDSFVFSSPEEYMSKDEWLAKAAEEEQQQADEQAFAESVLDFLKNSDLADVQLDENTINMQGRGNNARLSIIKFGPANETLGELGIAESAIKPLDSTLRQFNSMLGEMRAVPISDYIVIFHPHQNNVLVTKIC
jgi:hypothetical protein